MNAYLLVAAGGALGAAARLGLSRAWPASPAAFPAATLAANTLGGLLIGLVAACALRQGAVGEPARLFLGVGLAGGFTTFSAFSLETLTLLERGAAGLALTYVAASLLLALGATAAGLLLGRGLWPA